MSPSSLRRPDDSGHVQSEHAPYFTESDLASSVRASTADMISRPSDLSTNTCWYSIEDLEDPELTQH